MEVREAIRDRRSIRRFLPRPVADDILLELVELGRLYASGGNLQPIRFAIVSREPDKSRLFAGLKWAMYLKDFSILPQQQPAAYLVLLHEKGKSCGFDLGAAATTVMLAAKAQGLDTCCLASFDRAATQTLLATDLEPALVIALGYADQVSRSVDMTGDHKYFEAPDGALQVPKLPSEQALIHTDTE